MDVIDAAYALVHAFPGGASALAPRAGFSSPHVLNSKVRPACTTHHLTLAEADRLTGLTGDLRIVQALAANHGCVLRPMASPGADEGTVLSRFLAVDSAQGDVAQVIREALADGLITPREMRQIERSTESVQAALIMLLRKLRAVCGTPTARAGEDAA